MNLTDQKADMKQLSLLLFLPILFPIACCTHAQGNFQPHWSSPDNAQYLESSGNQVHIKQRERSDGPREVMATAALNLPQTQNWKMSFGIRFGQMQDAAAAFRLMSGNTYVGWVGADGFYKNIGVFLGKDNEVNAVTVDSEWHQVSYISDGNKITAWLDGRKVGEGTAQNAPDSLVITNSQDMKVDCHQTGVWVRDIEIQAQDSSKQTSQVVLSNMRPSPIIVHDDEQTICCLPGDTLRLAGHFNSSGKLQAAFLDTGDTWMFKREAKGDSDDYSYDWQAPKAGVYTLEAAYLNDADIRVDARHLTVNVLGRA